MSGINQGLPNSIEEALALGYSLSQVDELRESLKKQNRPRPQSASRISSQQPSFPSIETGGSSDDESESTNSRSNYIFKEDDDQTYESLEQSVRQANHLAMSLLMEGDIEGSRIYLEQADQTIKNYNVGVNEEHLPLINALQVLTWNNEASWWKSNQDPAKALEVLGQALNIAESEVISSTDRATTCSNLAAVLSQLDRHSLALTYASEAVQHCKSALTEAKNSVSSFETRDSDLKKVKTVTGTFAVACHNLAVETEHVNGVAEALPWYKEAVHLAQSVSALHSEHQGDKDTTYEAFLLALNNAKKKHKRHQHSKAGPFKKKNGRGKVSRKQKKETPNVKTSVDMMYRKTSTQQTTSTQSNAKFDFGDDFWTPNPEKVELKSLKLAVSQRLHPNQPVNQDKENKKKQQQQNPLNREPPPNGQSRRVVKSRGRTSALDQEQKVLEATAHASKLLAEETRQQQLKAQALNQPKKFRQMVQAARIASTVARWSSMGRVRSGLGLEPSPSHDTTRSNRFPSQELDEEEQHHQDGEEDDEDESDYGDVFFVEKSPCVDHRTPKEKDGNETSSETNHEKKSWNSTGTSRAPLPEKPARLPKTEEAGPPSPFGEPDWNWRAPKAPEPVIKLEHPLLGAAKGIKRASNIRHKKMALWKEAGPLAVAAEVQARRSADYWDAAAAAAVRRWGKGYHHPGVQPPPGRHKPTGLNSERRPQSAPAVSMRREHHYPTVDQNMDELAPKETDPAYFNFVNRRHKPDELEISSDMIRPHKGYSLLAEPSSIVGDRLLTATRRDLEHGVLLKQNNELQSVKQLTTSNKKTVSKKGGKGDRRNEREDAVIEESLQRTQLTLAYEGVKVAALSRLLGPTTCEEEEEEDHQPPPHHEHLELFIATDQHNAYRVEGNETNDSILDRTQVEERNTDDRHQEKEANDENEEDEDEDEYSGGEYDDDFEDLGSTPHPHPQKEEDEDAHESTNEPSGRLEDVALEIVGREVRKHFEGYGMFCGVIVGPAGNKSWEIEYEDGDSEVLGWSEIQAILLPPTDLQSSEKTSVPNSPVVLSPNSRAAKYFYNIETDTKESEEANDNTKVNGVENIHHSKHGDDTMNYDEANTASLTTDQPLNDPNDPISSSARQIVSPGTIPITEMSVEEMMVMNLQRQIKDAIASDDLDRAATLNAKLSHLEQTLLK